MKFFSGFSFSNESELFKEWIVESDFTVVGFSYGAIKAFEYVLKTRERVDRLILISPAFFQNRDEKFKRLQLISFSKDYQKYLDRFRKNCSDAIDLSKYEAKAYIEELEELLYYRWDESKFYELRDKGVVIESIFGLDDKIIDVDSAVEFFKRVSVCYCIKRAGHMLR